MSPQTSNWFFFPENIWKLWFGVLISCLTAQHLASTSISELKMGLYLCSDRKWSAINLQQLWKIHTRSHLSISRSFLNVRNWSEEFLKKQIFKAKIHFVFRLNTFRITSFMCKMVAALLFFNLFCIYFMFSFKTLTCMNLSEVCVRQSRQILKTSCLQSPHFHLKRKIIYSYIFSKNKSIFLAIKRLK